MISLFVLRMYILTVTKTRTYIFEGSDPNETLPNGKTHLSDLLYEHNGQPEEATRLLIKYGADLDKKVHLIFCLIFREIYIFS